jgi:ribonuclease P protein component
MRWYASLRRAAEFARLRRNGRRAGFATLTAYGAPRRALCPKIGITVGRTVGNAVVRNRVRRQVRGALDALAPAVAHGRLPAADLLLVLRPAAASSGFVALAADVAEALARVGGAG